MRRALAIVVATALGCAASSDVSRTFGARCDRATECDDRCLPDGAQFPGGFCSTSCETDADCDSDAHCVDVEAGACLFTCASDSHCAFLGEGWTCQRRPSRGNPAREVTICLGA